MRETVDRILARGLVAFALAGGLQVAGVFAPLTDGGAAARTSPAANVSGQARVVDGDTIEVAGTKVRLEGIDAPELGQRCARKWADRMAGRMGLGADRLDLGPVKLGTWDCGTAAARELQTMIGRGEVTCASRGVDKYHRILGHCRAGGLDLNAEMVRRGYAWAFVKYSSTFVAQEAEARSREAGIWQAPSQPAWEYREKRWSAAESDAPQGCAIKGNISRGERIYHMPWSPWYAKTRIDVAKGEHWFCNEGEAVAAGFRPAVAQ